MENSRWLFVEGTGAMLTSGFGLQKYIIPAALLFLYEKGFLNAMLELISTITLMTLRCMCLQGWRVVLKLIKVKTCLSPVVFMDYKRHHRFPLSVSYMLFALYFVLYLWRDILLWPWDIT